MTIRISLAFAGTIIRLLWVTQSQASLNDGNEVCQFFRLRESDLICLVKHSSHSFLIRESLSESFTRYFVPSRCCKNGLSCRHRRATSSLARASKAIQSPVPLIRKVGRRFEVSDGKYLGMLYTDW
jgi:hypothetical protein